MRRQVRVQNPELLDLEANKMPIKRTVTSRGDNDEDFRRAVAFVSDTVKDAMQKR